MTPPVNNDTMSESHVRRPARVIISERQILTEFLKLYKTFPCLWDQKHMSYSNREARDQAYDQLLEKYKLYQEKGTIIDVKKKIEYMRCAYRREHKKVLMGKLHGSHYQPHLWYYNLLTFLNENQDDDGDGEQQSFKHEPNIVYEDSYEDTQEIADSDEEPTEPKRRKKSNMSSNAIYIDEQLQNNEEYLDTEILDQDQNHVELQPYIVSTEAEAFGRTVGFQLKELTQMQRILAEKLISDVIFQGRLGKLSVDTTIND